MCPKVLKYIQAVLLKYAEKSLYGRRFQKEMAECNGLANQVKMEYVWHK